MTLRLECVRRNYELEDIKHKMKSKRIQYRDNPLAAMVEEAKAEKAEMLDDDEPEQVKNNGQGEVDDDNAATSITHKLGQKDPLADFHKLEVMMVNRNEFETWEAKKLKIFAQFKAFTDD
jgi:hypothetical protein